MTAPVYLTEEEWDLVNSSLPDVYFVGEFIGTWPAMDHISTFDMDLLRRLRVSNVCFFDSFYALQNARYALGHAIGVRKYYMDRSLNERDAPHVLADMYSRFYADYVPLLLWSAGEHFITGLLTLFDKQEDELKKYKAKSKPNSRVSKAGRLFETEFPKQKITEALIEFDKSAVRQTIWKYRNDWVHNKPPRIETIRHDLPRNPFIVDDLPWKVHLIGVRVSFDYLWDDFIEKLKVALTATSLTLALSLREWEREYNNSQK